MAEDIFAETNASEVAPATVAPVAAPVGAETSPPAIEPVAAPAAVTPPPTPVEPQDPTAPLRALLDERDRRQAAERKAAELEARELARERQRQQAAAQAPNPIEDPEGFSAWVQSVVNGTRQQVTQELQDRIFERTAALSRSAMQRQLGTEKWNELAQFIDQMPDAAHEHAAQQDDPYEWFHEQFQRAAKAKRAEALTAKLGDKDFEAYIEEQVAARLAAQAQAAAPAEEQVQAPQGQPRRADGTFAPVSPPPQQRRSAPSLAVVGGAPPASTRVNDVAYFEDEFKKG